MCILVSRIPGNFQIKICGRKSHLRFQIPGNLTRIPGRKHNLHTRVTEENFQKDHINNIIDPSQSDNVNNDLSKIIFGDFSQN